MKKRKEKVFIVEDNPQYNYLLQSFMDQRFEEVGSFISCEEAMSCINDEPDLWLLDDGFVDGMQGLELMDFILEKNHKSIIVFFSAQPEALRATEALKRGASDYICKGDGDFQYLDKVLNRLSTEKSKTNNDKKYLKKILAFILIPLISLLLLNSCISITPNQRLEQKPNTALTELIIHNPHLIGPDDKVSISVWNNENLSVGSIFGIYNSNEVYGKWILVDKDGYIQVPSLGKQKIGGLSCSQAADSLALNYSINIKNPIVIIKILNREVTMLGEFIDPGTYTIDREKNNLSELLGRAGGFTDYAKLKNIELIRTIEDIEKSYTINFKETRPELIKHIQIQAGDVIIAHRGNGKKLEKQLPLIIPFTSLATGIAVLFTVFK